MSVGKIFAIDPRMDLWRPDTTRSMTEKTLMVEYMHTPGRRILLKSAIVSAIVVWMCSSFAVGQEAIQKKPNVVILFIDDLGFGDLGCFGNKRIPTPNIDSLATQGVRCTMSYITNTPTIVTWPRKVPAGSTFEGMMGTIDFYATVAAAAGKPLPERCAGKNIVPYLKGDKLGDVHEYNFWHNADPTDAPRRNLYAVRWKDWRLIKDKEADAWRLFDLRKDPRETKDRAASHSEVVANMRERYDTFVATLPPLNPSADYKGGGQVPKGWGWEIGNGK